MNYLKSILLLLLSFVILFGCKPKQEPIPRQTATQQLKKQNVPKKILKITDIEMPIGYSLVDSSNPYVQVLTPYAAHPVMLLEMKEEKLFEIVTGTEPGKFMFDEMLTGEGTGTGFGRHYAVNSKGEIYFLDPMNNRIQKFSRTGKYIKSIAVPARAGKNGESAVKYKKEGIPDKQREKPDAWCILDESNFYLEDTAHYYYFNRDLYYFGTDIAVDGQDILYFLLVKNVEFTRFMHLQGEYEVWQFINDKLVKKYPHRIISYEFNNDFTGRYGTVYDLNDAVNKERLDSDKLNIVKKKHYIVEVIDKDNCIIKLTQLDGNQTVIKLRKDIDIFTVLGRTFVTEDSIIRIYTTHNLRDGFDGEIVEYNLNGNCLGVFSRAIHLTIYGNCFAGKIEQDGYAYNRYPYPLFLRVGFKPILKDE
ncbi:MAG: hypothetical protein ABII64_00630 [Elusimicrobiota bacterium]